MFERSVLNELFIFVKSKLGIYFDDYEVLLLRRVSEPFAAWIVIWDLKTEVVLCKGP